MSKLRKRVLAAFLSVVVALFGMTVYAGEFIESEQPAIPSAEEAETEYHTTDEEWQTLNENEVSWDEISEAENSSDNDVQSNPAEELTSVEQEEDDEAAVEPVTVEPDTDEQILSETENFTADLTVETGNTEEISETDTSQKNFENLSDKKKEADEKEDGLVITFADTNVYEYTGAAIKPDIEVKNNGKRLTEGVDYTVKYSNNVNACTSTATDKQPKVTVTGKGNFSGTTSATFQITGKNINAEDVIKGRIVVVRGKPIPMPSIYYGSRKLTAKDFSYDKAAVFHTIGNQTLTVAGSGNFSGSTVVEVAVTADAAAQKENAKKFTVTIDQTKAKALIYTGESLEEAIRGCIQVNAQDSAKTNLTLNADQNYRLAFPKDVTNAGTIKFTVTGTGAYSGCNVTKSCRILPKSIQAGDIFINDDGAKETMDGKVMISGTGNAAGFKNTGGIFADLSLKYGSKDMTEGRDYRVSYSSNRSASVGKAKYTISFIGNYKGKYTSPGFDIVKAELSERTVDSVLLPDKVCSTNEGVYKSNAYVSIDGAALKASEYEVKYYTDAERTQEMDNNNPVRLQNGSATVYVKILPAAKGNYTLSEERDAAKGSYTVWAKGGRSTDLSNAKVAFYDAAGRKVTKVDYTGRPVKPAKIVVTIGGKDFAGDTDNAPYTYEIVNNTNKGKAAVIIKAKTGSGYTGSKTASFTIVSRNIKDIRFWEKPTGPEQPTEPEEPTEPEQPTELESSTEPTGPEQPTEPEPSTEPTEPEQPTNVIVTNGGEEIALSALEHQDSAASSVVYYTSDISAASMAAIYQALGVELQGNIAVKLSTGEPPASNYLAPSLVADVVHLVDGTIVECNTAYGGQRASTALHYQVAKDHGFTDIADFVVLDENGSLSLTVNDGTHLSENLVGAHFNEYDGYLVLSHFKGHAMAGFGGAIKNISIGMGSSEGKCLIHTGGKSHNSPWGGDQDAFTESMAEAGLSVVDALDGNIVYINVMNRLSVDCDCNGNPARPDMHDIGILASSDPVALDQACVDLIYASTDNNASLKSRMESRNAFNVLAHGEEIGLGSRTYRLVLK